MTVVDLRDRLDGRHGRVEPVGHVADVAVAFRGHALACRDQAPDAPALDHDRRVVLHPRDRWDVVPQLRQVGDPPGLLGLLARRQVRMHRHQVDRRPGSVELAHGLPDEGVRRAEEVLRRERAADAVEHPHVEQHRPEHSPLRVQVVRRSTPSHRTRLVPPLPPRAPRGAHDERSLSATADADCCDATGARSAFLSTDGSAAVPGTERASGAARRGGNAAPSFTALPTTVGAACEGGGVTWAARRAAARAASAARCSRCRRA